MKLANWQRMLLLSGAATALTAGLAQSGDKMACLYGCWNKHKIPYVSPAVPFGYHQTQWQPWPVLSPPVPHELIEPAPAPRVDPVRSTSTTYSTPTNYAAPPIVRVSAPAIEKPVPPPTTLPTPPKYFP